ncbi:cellulose biosynthesis cyclic di-GMP-binding regulatory protein BcsB [Rhizobium sp. DKSPLA3]|uniref:Cyclic di-GMP-binding protein n=1 Tax=Rhizobium quercicola TaxID=2901226 RepID=A0A9X1NPH5_9HYPH|nr:cellulose biosynthesis cyclic di-GMP-binding regulatory protein BcsB [Rhizobium quercicola]MCD7107990.1 cellulose biosynthesis cyclic di-GMP-binding regulatory protein BcsB [Rhizobium quercicola]
MFKSSTLALALLPSLLLAGLSSTALAQTLGQAPGQPAAAPAPFRFNTPSTATAPAPLADVGGTLRKIAASPYDLFFDGEFASRKLSFFARPDEASSASRLVLTLQTAISAAPERSNLTIQINGREIGATSLTAGDPRRVTFDIPAGIIQPGYNAVAIAASHRHRVDCSVEATYELWTKIDPAQSGFVFPSSEAGNLTMIDLMPLAGTREGRTNLRVILPKGAQMADYDRALNVVQALAIAGNLNHPQVEFGATPGTGAGIDIYVGVFKDIAALLGAGAQGLTSGEAAIVAAGATPERKRLIISGLDTADLDAKTQQFVQQATRERPVGTPEGLAALTNMKGRLLVPGEKVTLSDLGLTAKPFDGRFMQSKVNFTMPSDFYPGAYSSMSFHLNALYVGGLSPDAVLTVKANDKVVANIPLSSPLGGAIRDQRLPIPFTALRPGQNTLQIEARLPSKLDAACESVDKATSTARLSLDGNSYLDIPNYARVGRYPDIAALTSGLPAPVEGDTGAATTLLVPNYNAQSMDAAATFVAKMAYASGQVKPMQYTSLLPAMDTANLIAFGGYDTLPSELVSRMNLDFVNIRNMAGAAASPYEVAALENFGPQSDMQRQMTTSVVGTAVDLSQTAGSFLAAPVERSAEMLQAIRSKAASELSKLNLAPLRAILGDEIKPEAFAPTAQTTLVIAQNAGGNGGLWTVVASKSASGIVAGTDVLTDLNVWNTLGGSVQAFSETGIRLDQQLATNQTLYQTQPFSLSNMRLVTASWLANNATVYIFALLTAAILLGLGTYMVLTTGRRNHG